MKKHVAIMLCALVLLTFMGCSSYTRYGYNWIDWNKLLLLKPGYSIEQVGLSMGEPLLSEYLDEGKTLSYYYPYRGTFYSYDSGYYSIYGIRPNSELPRKVIAKSRAYSSDMLLIRIDFALEESTSSQFIVKNWVLINSPSEYIFDYVGTKSSRK